MHVFVELEICFSKSFAMILQPFINRGTHISDNGSSGPRPIVWHNTTASASNNREQPSFTMILSDLDTANLHNEHLVNPIEVALEPSATKDEHANTSNWTNFIAGIWNSVRKKISVFNVQKCKNVNHK